ncbi:MAG: hypothetical protein VB064_13145 [Oscillospiraceae bacterium]|nr:hypothetical protein [Oscillospiraceae bacterium]
MKNAVKTIKKHLLKTISKANTMLSDTRGDLATNTIGGIIVAVVTIGLLIVAVNAFFPGFFTDMFSKMAQELNSNW